MYGTCKWLKCMCICFKALQCVCSVSLCISHVDLRIIYLLPLESIICTGDYLPEVWVSNAGVSQLSSKLNKTLSTVEPVPTSTGLSQESDIQKDQQQQTWAVCK